MKIKYFAPSCLHYSYRRHAWREKIIIGVLGLVFNIAIIGVSFAQTKEKLASPSNFSLKQCIDYALQNQYSLKNATINEAIANEKVGEVTAAGLPQINGSIQFTHNDPLRRMFGVGNGSPNFIAGKVVPDGVVFAIPNIFQLANGGDATLTISQLLFSSSYIIGLQAAKTYKELSSKAGEQSKIQVIEAVTKAYFMVLINKERLILFDKNVSRLDSLLTQTKIMNKNGFVENIDVSRIQVTYNNISTEREKFANLLLLSEALLKFQMSMTLNTELILSEKISDYKVERPLGENQQKSSYSKRIEYSLLESQKKLQLLDYKKNKAAYLPTLAAFANMGYFSQSPKFDFISKNNGWFNYGLFGITMNVPIFDGLGQHHRISQSRLNLQITENNLSTIEQTIDLQIRVAELTLKNSINGLEFQKENIELAKEVARVTKIKYQEGIGTSLEVTAAESSLVEAQTNYYNALYDALIAKIDFEKANGELTKK